METTLALLCALCVVVTVTGEVRGWTWVKAVSKACASLLFLAFGAQLGLWQGSPATMVALALSVVGDLALISTQKRWFLAGLGAFLLAHVGYVVAFAALGISEAAGLGAAVVAVGFAAGVWRWLGPHVGGMARPVQAYVLVICAMMCTAAGVAAVGGPGRLGVLLGALVFAASDLCVARQRFIKQEPLNRVIGLPLYYGAQLWLAWSVAAVLAG